MGKFYANLVESRTSAFDIKLILKYCIGNIKQDKMFPQLDLFSLRFGINGPDMRTISL